MVYVSFSDKIKANIFAAATKGRLLEGSSDKYPFWKKEEKKGKELILHALIGVFCPDKWQSSFQTKLLKKQ